MNVSNAPKKSSSPPTTLLPTSHCFPLFQDRSHQSPLPVWSEKPAQSKTSVKQSMDFMAEPPPPPLLPDLILSLEQATFMAKELPSTTDQAHLLQIYTSLHTAHHNLSNFLSRIEFPPPPPPPMAAGAATENSFSSATGVNQNGNGNEPMELGDDEEIEAEEEISKGAIEKVEEKMRDCFIKNKRPKRPLSPSTAAAAEERRLSDDGFFGRVKDYDAHAMRLRDLDLVYQFHG